MTKRGDPLWQERLSRLRARPKRHRNLTGNKDLEAEGKADRQAGVAKEKGGHAKDRVEEVIERVEHKAREVIDKTKAYASGLAPRLAGTSGLRRPYATALAARIPRRRPWNRDHSNAACLSATAASPAAPISMRLPGLNSRSREIQSPDRERSHVRGFARGLVEVAVPCAVLQTAR